MTDCVRRGGPLSGGDDAPAAPWQPTSHRVTPRGVRTPGCRGAGWLGDGSFAGNDRGGRWWPHEADWWPMEEGTADA